VRFAGDADTYDRFMGRYSVRLAPFTLGVGPAGIYLASLDIKRRDAVRARCKERLGPGPLTIESRAWTARGDV
jgi:hypothetical protein